MGLEDRRGFLEEVGREQEFRKIVLAFLKQLPNAGHALSALLQQSQWIRATFHAAMDLRQRFFAAQGYDVIRESIGHLVLRTWLRLRHEMPAAHSEFGNMEAESAGAWV
jgi:hypothetical protein